MLLIQSKKAFLVALIAIVALSAIFFISCEKEYSLESDGPATGLPDLSSKVISSVSGFVTDENDLAIANANVIVGNKNTLSDKYGFFEIKDAEVVKDAAVVTVDYAGYFKGLKSYMATEGKGAFFRIKLIPKVNVGNIEAATGGNIALPNGFTIALPANAVVNAATNSPYNGLVKVAANWINPTDKYLNQLMPGDLRGLDTAGSMKLLTTYGMAAVELTGTNGELLQMAENNMATLTMPLPPDLAGKAPSTIPLWYFDETTGLWKEEGEAIKTGDKYICEVAHFSYWNCDVPANFVRFSCTVTDAKGRPIVNALVKISVVGSPEKEGYGYTDVSGYTSGGVPVNAQLLLEVFGEYNCLSGLTAKNFTTTTTNIDLGKIVIPAAASATITGKVTNCSNTPVTDGFIIMKKDGLNYYKALSNTGTFNFTTALCNNNTPATFFAEDKTAMKASEAVNVTLISGENTLGTMIACNISTLQFLNYSINGTDYSFTAPMDSLSQYAKPQNNPPSIIINASSLLSNNSLNQADMAFMQTGIALNSLQNLFSFNCQQMNSTSTIVSPIQVRITEYGAIGEFMAGNFTGTFRGPAPGNTSYAVTCDFRVRRNQ